MNADNVAQAAIIAWAAERGIQVDYTEDLTRFSNLNNYQAVVFLGSNRDTLDDTAQTNLLQYVRRGGGFVGVHNAFGAEYHWDWYEGLLGGANFYDHAPNRAGTVETVNDDDVSTAFMPKTWAFTDEWYNLEPYPSYVNVLLEVDKATSLNGRATGHPGHGEHHPVSWCHYYDGGKAFLTTLGHDVALYTDAPLAGEDLFKQHLMSGIESAMGITPFCEV
nr:ThuA domain-containing protein [Agromyces seonyuensis]